MGSITIMPSDFQIVTFTYGDEAGFGLWLDLHYRQHLRYNNVLAARSPPVVLSVFDILAIPQNKSALKFWLDSHENWHELIRPFANVAGINLAEIDFGQPDQFYQWLDLHAQEHAQIDLALGVA